MISYYWKIYRVYLKNFVKQNMEYRLDFIIGVLSMFAEQGLGLGFIFIVFNSIPHISGWGLPELLLMYAFATMGRSFHITFFDGMWTFGWKYIKTGEFDRLLTKPVSPLFQVISERVQYMGVFQFLIGLIALIYAWGSLNIPITFINVALVPLFVLGSAMIYVGICLFFMVFSFWMVDSLPIMFAMFSFDRVSRYPIVLFPQMLAGFLTFILPYAFTGYYPATFYFTGSHFSVLSLFTPIAGLICCMIAGLFWKIGMRSYSGAGS